MSLSNTSVKQVYTGNGSNVNFAIPFDYQDATQVKVYTVDITNLNSIVTTLKTNPTHYTIVGSNVVFGTAPVSGLKVVVVRETSLEQTLDLLDSGGLLQEDLEAALDRIVMMIQELNARAIMLPSSYRFASFGLLPQPVPSKVIAIDSAGNALELLDN